jgi:hypothetical protein
MKRHDPLWAIVISMDSFADEPLIDDVDEPAVDPRPIETRMEETLARAARLTRSERIMVCVSKPGKKRWAERLADLPPRNVIVQPYDRGTAPAMLLPFFHVFRRDPSAKVLVMPAHHHVDDERILDSALLEAASETPNRDNRAVLLGMAPDGAREATWILPSETTVGPTREIALIDRAPAGAGFEERGAMVMSGILATHTSAMLRLFDHALPGLLRTFLVNLRGQSLWSQETLSNLYRFLPKKDLIRDLLLPSAEICRVLPVEPCGFRDLSSADSPDQGAVLRSSDAGLAVAARSE